MLTPDEQRQMAIQAQLMQLVQKPRNAGYMYGDNPNNKNDVAALLEKTLNSEQYVTPYEPSATQDFRYWLGDKTQKLATGLGASEKTGEVIRRQFAGTPDKMGAADLVPLVGDALGFQDAGRIMEQGSSLREGGDIWRGAVIEGLGTGVGALSALGMLGVTKPLTKAGSKFLKNVAGDLASATRRTDIDDLGFYSPTQRAAENIQAKGTGEQLAKQLEKGGNRGERIAEEMEDMGLTAYLMDRPKATQQEIQDYIAANRLKYGETVQTPRTMDDITVGVDGDQFVAYDANGNSVGYGETHGDAIEMAHRYLSRFRPNQADAKYQQYAQSGGKNYQESLLTVPPKEGNLRAAIDTASDNYNKAMELRDGDAIRQALKELTAAREAYRNSDKSDELYNSTHYDPANINLTTRSQNFETTGGDKVHLMDELQSDWHSEGRSKGYNTGRRETSQADWDEMNALDRQMRDAGQEGTPEYADLQERIIEADDFDNGFSGVPDNRVPNAPAKKSWVNQGIKNSIDKAVKSDQDYFAWTGGDIQAQRYNLSDKVDEFVYDAEGTLHAYKDGELIIERVATPEELPNIIGKGNADKLLEQPEFKVDRAKSPDDLRVVKKDGHYEVRDHNNSFISNVPSYRIANENLLRELMNDPMINQGGSELPMLTDKDFTEDFARQQAWRKIEAGDAYDDNKVFQSSRHRSGSRVLNNGNFEVGGEGMKGFYDKDVLKRTENIIKGLDPKAKVEIIELDNGNKVWGVKLTDQMKGKVKSEGQSMYSMAPVVGAGLLGSMLMSGKEEERQNY